MEVRRIFGETPEQVFAQVEAVVGGDVASRHVIEGMACYDRAGGQEVAAEGRGGCHDAVQVVRGALKDPEAPVWAYRLTEDIRDVVWVAYRTLGTGSLAADGGSYAAAILGA